jgi:hypothetical protein
MAGGDDGEWAAVPAVDPSSMTDDEAASTLEVDGEVFELRPDGFGGALDLDARRPSTSPGERWPAARARP